MNSSTQKQQQHECNSTSTSTPPEEHNPFKFQDQTNHEQALTIELPSNVLEFDKDNEPTTPTSSNQKIPVFFSCPPAPRKPKRFPMGNKRKNPSFKKISVDLMVMINAMFDPVGDHGSGDHAKKVKKAKVTTGS